MAKTLALSVVILLALTFLNAASAAAQQGQVQEGEAVDPFNSDATGQDTAVIEFAASAVFVADFEAVFVPERDHVSFDPAEPVCALEGVISSDGQGNLNYGCLAYWHCGGERVDDLYSGELSGTDASGAYAEYLTVASALASADGPIGDIDLDLLNNDILEGNLGEPDELLLLPVFYYCRSGANGPLELDEPAFAVSFGWDTNVEAEYDLDRVSANLSDELFALLEARSPQLDMTPPLEKRITIIHFPSWFWVDGDLPPIEISGLSDRGTLLMTGRATVDHVEWHLGDETLDCTLDQMAAWDPNDGLHPAHDRPFCSHVFTTLGQWELAATIHYKVEQQLSQRYGQNGTFIQGPWEPHPTQPTFTVTTTAGTLQTHEIYSMNVPIDS